jgi:hypothetical protein
MYENKGEDDKTPDEIHDFFHENARIERLLTRSVALSGRKCRNCTIIRHWMVDSSQWAVDGSQ